MTEAEFIAALRTLPLHPGARGLADDVAVLHPGGPLVLTLDTMVEGVHYLAGDPAEDVAWKLAAVNLSDLAAKGAKPAGLMLSYPLGDDAWDRAFLRGLDHACAAFGAPLLGGDTVSLPPGAPRVLSLTALGTADAAPPRAGGRAGDALWVTGTIGDAGAGLTIARGEPGPAALLARYRRPTPRLAEGAALAAHVHAMCDVSDGLLIDAARLAAASGLGAAIDLAAVPLSEAYRDWRDDTRAARLTAATAGDDYELLFAAPSGWVPPLPATRVGALHQGAGLRLIDGTIAVPLPTSLGYEHQHASALAKPPHPGPP